MDGKLHASVFVLNVRADCDSYHFLVAAKVRNRLSVRKMAARKFHMRISNLKKLKYVNVREQYQLRNPKNFAVLENLNLTVGM
jgi:hypothetical protein